MGQLSFFAEYLEATGLFDAWLKSCPLRYTSPNAPKLVDVLGTWMLSILDGQWRYAHVGALRGDGVAPSILGMSKIISDDSLRRALSAIAPEPDEKHTAEQRAVQQAQVAAAMRWMQEQLKHSVAEATATPWNLDCDTTIKPLYGKQAGAVVGYNPHKPGRPSHAIHTYWIGNLRWFWTRSWSLATGTARCTADRGWWRCWRACPRASGPSSCAVTARLAARAR